MPGRTRSVLLRLEVRPAGRACNCHRDKRHRILQGQPRLVVKNPGPAAGEGGYCGDCAEVMLKAAQDTLASLQTALSSFDPTSTTTSD
jgi:hypothetical protein